MLSVILLLAGFVPLIYGADLLVDNASSLAKKLNIPSIVIGLTIVAFGTSAPELIVNIFASVQGNSNIALGNIVGSNILNIMIILGISSIIYPLAVKSNTTWIEIPLCLLAAIIIIVFANDVFIDKGSFSAITRIDGIILLMFFLIFLFYNFQLMKTGSFSEEISVKDRAVWLSVLLIFAGLLLLVVGGKLIVDNAVNLARFVGISERIIALTIVSFGTSLPELATSIVAARKRNVDIAIGNVVGSNIFNTFFILGTSAVISPVAIQANSLLDMAVNIFASLLLFFFIINSKKRSLVRWEGIVFILLYIGYLAAMFLLT